MIWLWHSTTWTNLNLHIEPPTLALALLCFIIWAILFWAWTEYVLRVHFMCGVREWVITTDEKTGFFSIWFIIKAAQEMWQIRYWRTQSFCKINRWNQLTNWRQFVGIFVRFVISQFSFFVPHSEWEFTNFSPGIMNFLPSLHLKAITASSCTIY